MKKAFIWAFVAILLFSTCVNKTVYASNTEGMDILTFSEEDFNLTVKPGEKTYIKLPVRTKGDYILDPVVSIEATEGSPFTFSKPTMISEFGVPVVMMTNNITANIEFEVSTKETAGIRSYPVNLIVKGTSSFTGEYVVATLPFELKILEEKAPSQLTVRKVESSDFMPGRKANLSFIVKNEGEIKARNAFVNINYGESGITRDYSAVDIKIGDLGAGEEKKISIPTSVLSTATIGRKTLIANFTYKTIDGEELENNYDFTVNIQENKNAPSLDISGVSGNEGLKLGEEFELAIELGNFGLIKAQDIRISIDSEAQNNFIKNYFTEYIGVNSINADSSKEVKLPLIVSRNANNGFNELKLDLQYKDEMGIVYSKTKTIYLEVAAQEDKGASVIISNVKQVPEKPVAGGKLEVSFDMTNKGAIDLNEFKIMLSDLTGTSFIPVESDPYKHIGVVKAGETKKITIPLTVSENIQEGLNALSIEYSYTGGGNVGVDIPILNVQNELGSASKPKIIVSKYEVDVDELRSGSVFNLNFEVRNTHSSVAAKNIIITVSGKSPDGQDIFTVTKGSNSFFVNRIGAGETFSEELEMKVKSDTATKAYPIYIKIEYEYDGIKPNPQTGEIGEEVTHELNLQVVENARPVVDYVDVYSWDMYGVMVGSPANLAFEFYNMGKSMLNNVIATVEGDFTSSGGNMYFMGNVNAGDRSFAEFEVIPNVEGMAYGVIKITYEDSIGDEQVYTKEFESFVSGEQAWDFDNNYDDGLDAYNPDILEPKKAILPIWAFVVLQVVISIIFIPVTRKIIIKIYRSRRLKQEEEMF